MKKPEFYWLSDEGRAELRRRESSLARTEWWVFRVVYPFVFAGLAVVIAAALYHIIF